MSSSETPQNSDYTSQKFLKDKSRLQIASISLVLLLVLLPVFQFVNVNGHFQYQYGMDQTLFILIYLSFALIPIFCLFFLIKLFLQQNREIIITKIILGVSLYLFLSQLYSITLSEMSLPLRSSILFTIFVLGSIAIHKSSKTLVWGLAWLLVFIFPATLYHGYQQYSYLSKPSIAFKPKPIIPKNDRHNIYLIFLDGSIITSSYLDEDRLPKKEFLPNFREFIIEDANWFPNSVSNSPQTFLSYPTLISGKLFSSRTNNYLDDEQNIFSILKSNYKINSFTYEQSKKSLCRANPKLCN
jgi:uncharacterized membrane protein